MLQIFVLSSALLAFMAQFLKPCFLSAIACKLQNLKLLKFCWGCVYTTLWDPSFIDTQLPLKNHLMKIGNFEVQVTSPEGLPFHEVCDSSTGEIYIVAEAGERFELRYRTDPRSVAQLLPHSHEFFFMPKIDGRCTGVAAPIKHGTYEGKHVGFVRHGDAEKITYDLFKFASATANEAIEANSSMEFKEGKIEVTVQENRPVPEKGQFTRFQDNKVSKVPSLPEGSYQPSSMMCTTILVTCPF
jgi:hypothetical protein